MRGGLTGNNAEKLQRSSHKTVLVLVHISSIQIFVLLKPSGDGHMQKSSSFNPWLSAGSE